MLLLNLPATVVHRVDAWSPLHPDFDVDPTQHD
jgi:hypothetical protein